MRTMALGAMMGAGFVLAIAAFTLPRGEVFAQRTGPERAQTPEGLIAMSAPAGDGRQMVTVIDPGQRAMSVYHVDVASGEITLKSVRNIQWDLQMLEFNGTAPLPREIRAVLESRQ